MPKQEILVEGKSKFWHMQLRVCMESCTPRLNLEDARGMSYGDLLVYAGAHIQSNESVKTLNLFQEADKEQRMKLTQSIKAADDKDSLLKIWNNNPDLKNKVWFINEIKDRKQFLIDEGKIIL